MAQARRNFGSALICGRNPAGRHGVSTESGSDRVKADSNNRDCRDYYPVATALGTDLILKLGHYSWAYAKSDRRCTREIAERCARPDMKDAAITAVCLRS